MKAIQRIRCFTLSAYHLVTLSIFLIGCHHNAAATSPTPPIGAQMLQIVPDLQSQPFSNLLNFESASDRVFVSAGEIDHGRAHTGTGSLRISDQSGRVTMKLSSLLGPRAFPDRWTLVGAYFYSEKPARIVVACTVENTVIARNEFEIPAGQWTAAMVDLTEAKPLAGAPLLELRVSGTDVVWCDDAVLVDNTQYLVGDDSAAARWSVCRRGFSYVCSAPGRFTMRLDSVEATSGGWNLEEANILRARFSSAGRQKVLTLYADGRCYTDGEFRAVASALRSEPLWAQQHKSPARVEVADTMGRPDRRSSGDANNDGYDESRGTYRIIATGPRLELTIAPRSVPVLRPILEITGLPQGNALVTVEGRLVEVAHRVNGTLLVEIPVRIDRPTAVSIGVQ